MCLLVGICRGCVALPQAVGHGVTGAARVVANAADAHARGPLACNQSQSQNIYCRKNVV